MIEACLPVARVLVKKASKLYRLVGDVPLSCRPLKNDYSRCGLTLLHGGDVIGVYKVDFYLVVPVSTDIAIKGLGDCAL